MSSGEPDPAWGPPTGEPGLPGPPRRPRGLYVVAIVLPLLMIIALVVPFGALFAFGRWQQSPAGALGGAGAGSPGVGDPYFPDYGSSGYDARKYTIKIDWDTKNASMKATTTISARSTQSLESFYFDLALDTDRVLVNGNEAEFELEGFQDVKVTPAEPIEADTDFEVTVDYSGAPGEVEREGESPFYSNDQEWTIAGEPESSAWWFPANDHPSDPALMESTVRVPADMEVISVGRLESRDIADEEDFDTWHWLSRQPMATYLNFLSIGQFQIKETVADGRPTLYAVSAQLPENERKQAFAQLEKSAEVVAGLEKMFGPYPFTELGGVVPAANVWFGGLETQTRPVYRRKSIINKDFANELITHELAHMWFGNQVTLEEWDDIFMNEAYASWADWGLVEQTGGRSANEAFLALFEKAEERPEFWKITMHDPGKEQLFDTVYNRGPMTLQALRNVIGDDAFTELNREWAQQPGSRSLEDWMIMAQTKTSTDLGPFFETWIFGTAVPERTPANGFN